MAPHRAAVLLALVLLSPLSLTRTAADDGDVVADALDYVASRQGADGRWTLSSQGYPIEAAAAAGADAKRWPTEARPAFAALTPESAYCEEKPLTERQDCAYKTLLRVVHAAGAAGYDPRDLNGIDGVAQVRAGFVGNQFGQPIFVNDDIWAILALRAAGVPASDTLVQAGAQNVLDARNSDGGWDHLTLDSASDVDMTGAALAALAAAGLLLPDPGAARAFLIKAAAGEGYAPRPGGTSPSCQSTAWAIHGLTLLGHTDHEGALSYLASLRKADGGLGLTLTSAEGELFCTVEALVPLAGARYPLPSYAPTVAPRPVGHAKEAIQLRIPTLFTRGVWDVDGVMLEARTAAHVFPAAGVYPYRLLVEGEGLRARVAGEVRVLSARPTLGALPATITLPRHTPLVLDLANASDPDGLVERAVVDWGDGNMSDSAQRRLAHAYALPGEYTLQTHVIDDAGVESHPTRILVHVQNRAPHAPALPVRVLADRVEGVALTLAPEDPDGDAVVARWSYGNASGEGAPRFVPTTLGNGTLMIVLSDPFGGETATSVPVEVVNLPPTVSIVASPEVDGEIVLRADARDADGPVPALTWRVRDVDHEGDTLRLRLAAEPLLVELVATDVDDARASATLTLPSAAAPGDERAPPPEIHALDARLEEGTLVVSFEATEGARLLLSWTSDVGDGVREDVASPARVPLPGASWATARLLAERDGMSATRETGLLVAPAAAAPPPPAPPATQPVEVAAGEAPPAAASLVDAPAEAAGVTPEPQPRREAPAPSPGLGLAIALALALVLPAARRTRGP